MQQLDIKYNLKNTLACAISKRFEIRHVSLFNYPENSIKQFWVNEWSDGD